MTSTTKVGSQLDDLVSAEMKAAVDAARLETEAYSAAVEKKKADGAVDQAADVKSKEIAFEHITNPFKMEQVRSAACFLVASCCCLSTLLLFVVAADARNL
jgi:hypothetical protein